MLVCRGSFASNISDVMHYTVARGFMRSGQGNPDEARAARYILKDHVNGKLLFCHPPPEVSEDLYNARTHELALIRMAGKKRAPVTRVGKDADTFVPTALQSHPGTEASAGQGSSVKLQTLDREFFLQNDVVSSTAFIQGTAKHRQEFTRGQMYPHQNIVGNDGRLLPPGVAHGGTVLDGKKHHKGVKQRSGKGYD